MNVLGLVKIVFGIDAYIILGIVVIVGGIVINVVGVVMKLRDIKRLIIQLS